MLGIVLQLFFGDCLFFIGPQDLRSFAGLPCRFNTLYAKIFRELFFFSSPQEARFAMPWALHPQHCWGPVFPGFFPKLFCGLSTANIFQEKFGSPRFLIA